MMLLIVVAMTVAVVLLTVSFLGTLRGIAELRLRLVGYDFTGREPMRIDPGRSVPSELTTAFPVWSDTRGGIVFLADDCSACLKLADELGSLEHADKFLICPTSEGREKIEALLDSTVTMLPNELAAHVATSLNVTMTPVVVLQQDGYIIARGVGPGAETVEAIENLWRGAFGDADNADPESQPKPGGDRWVLTSKAS